MGEPQSIKSPESMWCDVIGPLHEPEGDTIPEVPSSCTSPLPQESYGLLQNKKNLISDEICELKRPIYFDPLSQLPVEIWSEIVFCATTRAKYREWEYVVSFDDMVSLTLVNSNWRNKILSFSQFWCHIVIDHEREDCYMEMVTCIHLSNTASIALYLYHAGHILKYGSPLFDILATISFRISRLYILDQDFLLDRSVLGVIQRLSAASGLTHLNIVFGSKRTKFIQGSMYLYSTLANVMTLRTVVGIYFSASHLQRAPLLNNLEEICVTGLSATTPVLEKMESLRRVSVILEHDLYTPPSSQSGLYQLPKLRWSSLKGIGAPVPLSVLTRLTASLVELVISVKVKSLPETLSVISVIEPLLSLDIELTSFVPGSLEEWKGASHPKPSNVRKLSIRSTLSHEVSQAAEDSIASLFHSQFPIVKEFDMSCSWMGWAFIREGGFCHVESISLSKYIPSSGNDAQLPPSCQILQIASYSFIALRSSTIRRVRIPPDIYQLRDIGVAADSDITQWPSLRDLTVPSGSLISFMPISSPLVHLTSLHIITSEHLIDLAITGACQQLTLYPWMCPALRTLTFDISPEWDIFFLFLERRNILSQTGISKIRSVTLPVRMPEPFMRLVRAILRGKHVERPSNWELSLVGNADIAFDPEIPGCTRCHRMLVTCQTKTMTDSRGTPQIRPLPNYPDTESEILASWKDRSLIWHERTRQIRPDTCWDYCRDERWDAMITLIGDDMCT